MPGSVTGSAAVAATLLTLLGAGVLTASSTRAAPHELPAPSSLRPADDLEPVPMPTVAPRRPGAVPMPLVEPHGRPVPMPLVEPGRSAGHLVPEELGRGR